MTEKPAVGTLDRDAVWHAIDTGRLALADLLDQLSDQEWRQPSLCAGWSVRDVAAHLTQQQVGFGAALVTMIRGRRQLNRAVRDAARRYAAAVPTERLIADIRGMVGSRRHNVGVTYKETLIDLLVHGQDIAFRSVAGTTCRWKPQRRPRAGCGPCAGRRPCQPPEARRDSG